MPCCWLLQQRTRWGVGRALSAPLAATHQRVFWRVSRDLRYALTAMHGCHGMSMISKSLELETHVIVLIFVAVLNGLAGSRLMR